MIILPAIDIKDGNCVRLFKGDFSTVEKVAADYMETAKGFEAAGASWIHMVDLDGAKEGRPVNRHIYEDVAAKTDLKVEVGGGIRNLETIDTYLKSGVERVILGSAAGKKCSTEIRQPTHCSGNRCQEWHGCHRGLAGRI